MKLRSNLYIIKRKIGKKNIIIFKHFYELGYIVLNGSAMYILDIFLKNKKIDIQSIYNKFSKKFNYSKSTSKKFIDEILDALIEFGILVKEKNLKRKENCTNPSKKTFLEELNNTTAYLQKLYFKNHKVSYVTFEITSKCNQNCMYCYLASKLNSTKEELSTIQVKTLIKRLVKELEVNRIDFTGGEPFIRKDFIEILEFCDKLGVFVKIKSNGSLIDKKIVERLKKLNNLINVDITILGFSEKNHNLFSKTKGFNKTKKALKLLSTSKKFFTKIVFVPTKLTKISEFKKAYNFANSHKLILSIEPFYPKLNGDLSHFKYKPNINKMNKILEISKKEENKKRVNVIDNMDKLKDKYQCLAGYGSMALSCNGDIYPCIILQGLIFGNAIKQNLIKILNKLNKTFPIKISDTECKDCNLKKYCGKCVLANVFEKKSLYICSDFNKKDAIKNSLGKNSR
jgi:radical SAM protein with 4Fe4S-binding SPASM domain